MRGDAGGYTLANKRGIIDEVCAHMEQGGVIWTKERCLEEALKYSRRWELGRANSACYHRILLMGWQTEAFAHMASPKNMAFSKEECLAESKKYSTPSEFAKGSPGHYMAAIKRGWKSEVFGHLTCSRESYDEDKVMAIAAQYRTRSEFQDAAQSAYSWARKNGVLEKVCAHMERRGNIYLRQVYEIRSSHTREIYIGISCDVSRRFRDHAETGTPEVRDVINRGAELRIISDLLPAEEAGKIEAQLIDEYRADGWKVLNTQEGGNPGAPYRRIALEEIITAAKSCKSRKEFRERYYSLAQAAQRWDLTDDLFRADRLYRSRR
jgi:predicted GIY-YIG superfamily endonuclease